MSARDCWLKQKHLSVPAPKPDFISQICNKFERLPLAVIAGAQRVANESQQQRPLPPLTVPTIRVASANNQEQAELVTDHVPE